MRELHCGRAEEQPGCDLVSVGNMTTEGKKKKAQGSSPSCKPVQIVHLKMPLRGVCVYAGPQHCHKTGKLPAGQQAKQAQDKT